MKGGEGGGAEESEEVERDRTRTEMVTGTHKERERGIIRERDRLSPSAMISRMLSRLPTMRSCRPFTTTPFCSPEKRKQEKGKIRTGWAEREEDIHTEIEQAKAYSTESRQIDRQTDSQKETEK
jgi:hypothetical protein